MENRHILVINYQMDDTSQVFAHQIEVVRRLALYYKNILVFTNHFNPNSIIPSNVIVFSCDWRVGKSIRNTLVFYRNFFKLLKNYKIDLIFSHMTEVQSALIAPISRFLKIPHLLWYAHTSKSPYLVWNSFFVDKIVTSTKGSCPLKNGKVVPIGQAIDENYFFDEVRKSNLRRRFLHIGRFDPSKNAREIINTIISRHEIDQTISLLLIGSPSTASFNRYALDLQIEYRNYSFIKFQSSVPRNETMIFLRENDVFIHAFQGSLDKTLVEATMAGLPVVTVNREYLNQFGGWNNDSNEVTLRSEFNAFLATSDEEIYLKCCKRQKFAISHHSLTNWNRQLISLFNDLMGA